ncbi:MAG: LacI family transcriptional regulator [Hyphomonas sp.]|nr:LacI family transcriptional regulator [Hyphomonas sp.]
MNSGPKLARSGNLTLKDVALEAGVTPMTVSNVLNGRDTEVGAETRERVKATIDRLGYRPHASARRLRSQRSFAIGVLVLDDVPQFLNDPFTTQVVAGISNFATECNYSVLLQGVRSDSLVRVPLLSQVQTDGVCAILSGPQSQRETLLQRLIKLHMPLVLIQERSANDDVCAVRQDDRGGAVEIARYLVSRGASRLMFLAPGQEWPAITERIDGVREVCSEMGADLRLVFCGAETLEDTQRAVRVAIEENGLPDAIMGGNDRMAMAAIQFLDSKGIQVPGEVRVTGFNGFDFAAYSRPSLVTVRSEAYEMGHRAAKELLARIETGQFSASDIVLPVSFIPGNSA